MALIYLCKKKITIENAPPYQVFESRTDQHVPKLWRHIKYKEFLDFPEKYVITRRHSHNVTRQE
jgi:hypothetical protein